MNGPEGEKIVDEAICKLAEHFDVVQVLVSWRGDKGTTLCSKRGCGNWYARIGMCHEMIESDKAQEQALQVADKIRPPPDDGDDWKALT